MMSIPVVGILLAGGQSRRMGSDKAELQLAGKSQLIRTKALLQKSGCSSVFISRNGAGGIADIYFNQGPIAGIHAVLNDPGFPLQCLALVVPVDMPLLNEVSLTELLRQTKTSGINGYYENCYLPCALYIDKSTKTELKKRLEQQQRSVKSYLFDSGAAALVCSDPQPLINTNTPNEWQQASQTYKNII